MKQKIFDALKQAYGKGSSLGLADESIERVATMGAAFITTDEQIPGFVTASESVFKSEQSGIDKVRGEYSTRLKVLEQENAELKKLSPLPKGIGSEQPAPTPQPESYGPQGFDQLKAILAEAVSEAVKPIRTELEDYKQKESVRVAVENAKSKFNSNDYVKKYSQESSDAWDRAFELFEATGRKWTEQELHDKAMGYFTTAVDRKGVDVTRPFESGNGSEDAKSGFGAFDRAAARLGWKTPDKEK